MQRQAPADDVTYEGRPKSAGLAAGRRRREALDLNLKFIEKITLPSAG
jgi:hypothetical protein